MYKNSDRFSNSTNNNKKENEIVFTPLKCHTSFTFVEGRNFIFETGRRVYGSLNTSL